MQVKTRTPHLGCGEQNGAKLFKTSVFAYPEVPRAGARQKNMDLARLLVKAYGQAQHTKYDGICGTSLIKAIRKAPRQGPSLQDCMF